MRIADKRAFGVGCLCLPAGLYVCFLLLAEAQRRSFGKVIGAENGAESACSHVRVKTTRYDPTPSKNPHTTVQVQGASGASAVTLKEAIPRYMFFYRVKDAVGEF